jgi:Fur family transcriptional regulator, peroxide stress response regulator
MHGAMAAEQLLVEDLRALFKRAGVKLTQQRLEIYRELAASREHPDAERIYQGVRLRLPTVSLDTVYRTLWLFINKGLITTLGLPQGRMRFDANMERHHHFVCTRCGGACDFYAQHFDALPLPPAVHEFGTALETHVEVRGLCTQCLDGTPSEQS